MHSRFDLLNKETDVLEIEIRRFRQINNQRI